MGKEREEEVREEEGKGGRMANKEVTANLTKTLSQQPSQMLAQKTHLSRSLVRDSCMWPITLSFC